MTRTDIKEMAEWVQSILVKKYGTLLNQLHFNIIRETIDILDTAGIIVSKGYEEFLKQRREL